MVAYELARHGVSTQPKQVRGAMVIVREHQRIFIAKYDYMKGGQTGLFAQVHVLLHTYYGQPRERQRSQRGEHSVADAFRQPLPEFYVKVIEI